MESSEKNLFVIAILIIVLVIAFALRMSDTSWITGSSEDTQNPFIILDQASCAAAGGNWNECASACRGQENQEACITLCIPICECTSDDACPFGYACGDFVDDIGVCQAE